MRLEYRLDDEENHFPALWHYEELAASEVIARMTCEYFVKDKATYRVTMTAKEADGCVIIYIVKEDYSDDKVEKIFDHIGLEYREVIEPGKTELLKSREVFSHEDAALELHCDVIYLLKDGAQHEFMLDSREIDEDRRCYVYYGTFAHE